MRPVRYRVSHHADVAELAYALGLGPSGQPWGFESPRPHSQHVPTGHSLMPQWAQWAVTVTNLNCRLPFHSESRAPQLQLA